MKINMGNLDRMVRAMASAIIAVLYFSDVFSGIFGTILLVMAVTLLSTSLVSFCPVYLPFGLSTKKANSTDPE